MVRFVRADAGLVLGFEAARGSRGRHAALGLPGVERRDHGRDPGGSEHVSGDDVAEAVSTERDPGEADGGDHRDGKE